MWFRNYRQDVINDELNRELMSRRSEILSGSEEGEPAEKVLAELREKHLLTQNIAATAS